MGRMGAGGKSGTAGRSRSRKPARFEPNACRGPGDAECCNGFSGGGGIVGCAACCSTAKCAGLEYDGQYANGVAESAAASANSRWPTSELAECRCTEQPCLWTG